MPIPKWFFALSGLVMIVVGVGLIAARPRPKHERGMSRLVNFGHMWAATCILFGVLVVLYALEAIPWPPGK
jgi:hypothetical protein